jgi:hypothetical protein
MVKELFPTEKKEVCHFECYTKDASTAMVHDRKNKIFFDFMKFAIFANFSIWNRWNT